MYEHRLACEPLEERHLLNGVTLITALLRPARLGHGHGPAGHEPDRLARGNQRLDLPR